MGYDVIVVGARVAGAATAMLLARRGLRVLVFDRARFPSDTVSSHQVQVPGVAMLHRWGLLDRVRASGAPPTRQVRLHTPGVSMAARFPVYQGVDALYSPRRTVLDALLIDAARAAGAEVRERARVEELVWCDGRVVGVRSGRSTVERARVVVGGDGKHSFVAKAVGAAGYRQRPVLSFASYGYWSGVPLTTGELHQRPGVVAAAFATNDDLTMVYTAGPIARFGAFRADVEANYLDALDRCGDLGERVRAGTRVERLRTTPDQPNRFHRPWGPGWALVGDAGVVMDSVSAQGITNALVDADSLAGALADGLIGGRPMPAVLADHHRRRDRAVTPMYDFTVGLARYRSRRPEQVFLHAVAEHPDEARRVLGAFAGILPVGDVFSMRNAARVVGGYALQGVLRRRR
jgi:2-polyprenyl-6-methoxyphenol hydroxylase-like FAD-dependent oxidoreductase